MNTRKIKDLFVKGLICLSALISGGILIVVVSFIFSNGWNLISMNFITRDFRDELSVVSVIPTDTAFTTNATLTDDYIFIENLGIELEATDEGFIVRSIDADSPTRHAVDRANNPFALRTGQVLEGVGDLRIDATTDSSVVVAAFHDAYELSLRVRTLGGGVWPLIVSTLLLVVVTLAIAAPIGILAAVYMIEYASSGGTYQVMNRGFLRTHLKIFRKDRIINLIRFAIEILAGMPSIIYGLFGLAFFNRMLGMGQSIFTGALTLTILLLPIMIRSTEEALKTVPQSYREASLGLGANKIQTIFKIILPNALSGIMVGIILSIGRIVGETAALLFTLGGFARMPINMSTGNLSIFEQGATLTLRAYFEVQESGNVEMAAAIGIVILVIVFTLNMISKFITKKFSKAV